MKAVNVTHSCSPIKPYCVLYENKILLTIKTMRQMLGPRASYAKSRVQDYRKPPAFQHDAVPAETLI